MAPVRSQPRAATELRQLQAAMEPHLQPAGMDPAQNQLQADMALRPRTALEHLQQADMGPVQNQLRVDTVNSTLSESTI